MNIFGEKSWAQHGDDMMLLNIFSLIGIEKPTYIDLGAHHPTEISNTHLLYTRGSNGINVEANPNLFQAFLRERPRDINVNLGVGVKCGNFPFYMFDDVSGLNTFVKEDAEEITRGNPNHRVRKTMNIPMVTINDIYQEHCGGVWPDLLLTDIEGLDHDVLEAADFTRNKPKVICAEIRPWKAQVTKKMLLDKGYFTYCRCQANLIFVSNRYMEDLY